MAQKCVWDECVCVLWYVVNCSFSFLEGGMILPPPHNTRDVLLIVLSCGWKGEWFLPPPITHNTLTFRPASLKKIICPKSERPFLIVAVSGQNVVLKFCPEPPYSNPKRNFFGGKMGWGQNQDKMMGVLSWKIFRTKHKMTNSNKEYFRHTASNISHALF